MDYIFIDRDIETLRGQINGGNRLLLKRLLDQCESYFSADLPEEHPRASSTYMGIAMANLSLAWLLAGEPRYLEEAKRWIHAVTSYPHWGNAHLVDVDLSAAWILFGLGIAYDWLKEDMTSEERKAVKEKVLLQGTRMYDFKVSTEGSGWSTNYWQNHNWINMTGLACAGYALVKEEEWAKSWIDASRENFAIVYSALPEDGSDYEGVVYWRYGAMWLFVYAHLLKEREGIDYFRTCPFLENTFTYRLYQAAPNLEEQINFGDAHDRRSGHSTAIYYKTAAEYHNGYAQKMGNLVREEFLEREAALSKVKPGILPECFFEVLFYDSRVKEKEFSDLPLTHYFDDLGLFVSRSSWEKEAIHFSFKCSVPGGKKQWRLLWELKNEKGYNCFGLSHQHPDCNSFIMNGGGEFFAIDDGYNRSVRASDHNVVLVDGKGYQDEGQNNIWKNYTPGMVPSMETPVIRNGYFYLCGEAAPVYDKSLNLKSFKRHVVGIGGGAFVIIDELISSEPHIYTWQMYSDVYPRKQGVGYYYEIGTASLGLYQFSDCPTDSETAENTVRAVMTTQEPDKFTETSMKGLRFSSREKVKAQRFFTLLLPEPDSYGDIRVEEIIGEGYRGILLGLGGEERSIVHAPGGQCVFNGKEINSSLFAAEAGLNGEIIDLRSEA